MSRFHVDPNETIDVYEFDPAETIADSAPNVITIRARMDVATAGRVSSELMQLGADNIAGAARRRACRARCCCTTS